MSHEINHSTVPSYNNGCLEPQPPPSIQLYPNIEKPIPQPQVVLQNTAQIVPPNGAPTNNSSRRDADRQKWFEDMHGWVMVVAVLVASVTYTSGLSPPGGFWQDDLNGHEAGASILHDKYKHRYTTFFYANATAFMASLIIIILLMNEKYYCDRSKVVMLDISMVLGLVSLMIAYAAGCARRVSTSIYVIVLAVGVLLFVVYSASILPRICSYTNKRAPWVKEVVGRDLIDVRDSVHKREGQNMTRSSTI